MSKAPAGKESGTPPGFNGFKVLWAAFIGAGIGVVLALFLETFIRNTPADLSKNRLLYLYGVVVASAALFGSSIESTRQLQEASPEKEYRQKQRAPRG